MRRRSPPCGAARLADRPSLGDPDPQENAPTQANVTCYGTNDGSVAKLVRTASTRDQISQRLQHFKGVGPKTAEIFLREVPDSLIGTA